MGRKVFVHIPAGGMSWFKETFSGVGFEGVNKTSNYLYLHRSILGALRSNGFFMGVAS